MVFCHKTVSRRELFETPNNRHWLGSVLCPVWRRNTLQATRTVRLWCLESTRRGLIAGRGQCVFRPVAAAFRRVYCCCCWFRVPGSH